MYYFVSGQLNSSTAPGPSFNLNVRLLAPIPPVPPFTPVHPFYSMERVIFPAPFRGPHNPITPRPQATPRFYWLNPHYRPSPPNFGGWVLPCGPRPQLQQLSQGQQSGSSNGNPEGRPRNYWNSFHHSNNNARDFNRFPRNIFCNFCHKTFSNFIERKIHQSEEHRPMECEFCGKVFRVKHDLCAHYLNCPTGLLVRRAQQVESMERRRDGAIAEFSGTGAPSAPPSDDSSNESQPKESVEEWTDQPQPGPSTDPTESQDATAQSAFGPFHCTFCNKRFPLRRKLYLHVREAHATVFGCESCPAQFKSQGQLNRHVYRAHASNQL